MVNVCFKILLSRWYPVPQREVDRRGGDRSIPMRTPTMAGGLFSIERDYFYEIGSYDAGNYKISIST